MQNETVTPVQTIAITPPFYPEFLSQQSSLDDLLLNDPLTKLKPLRNLDRFTPTHRGELVDAITQDLRRWSAPERAQMLAEELRLQGSYAVVTGQQAGIGGGPLYALYKAVGAIRVAEELRGLHPGVTFVPVFWIEADDHDFAEIRSMTLLDRSGDPREVSYDDGVERPLHVGQREVSSGGLDNLIAELQEHLPDTPFKAEAIELLRSSYSGAEGITGWNLADGFARTLYAMLGEMGMVVVSSRNPGLKRLAGDVVAREAADPMPLFNALEHRTAEQRREGLPTPISPKPGALFITEEGERRALDVVEGGYHVRGSATHYSFEEAAELARRTPEIFSPNVVLRPIVQDAILPSAIYLGGPSEVAYLAQIRDGYEIFSLARSAIAPRPFVLLLEPKAKRVIEQVAMNASPIELQEILDRTFDPAARLVDPEIDRAIEEGRNRGAEAIERGWHEMETVVKNIDVTLERSIGAGVAGSMKELDNLVRKLRTALKKREQTGIDRLTAARTMLLPGNELQERTIAPLSYISRYGLDRFTAVLGGIEFRPGVVQVLEM
jgi:bacillithiol biosynthesis cysteine-adding enzyme BshC